MSALIVQQASIVELRELFADLVGQSLQLSVDVCNNCYVVQQQLRIVDSMNSPPDAHRNLFLTGFIFTEVRYFIATAPRTLAGVFE